jgi:NADH:ubiquinone oxidoreductase subunit 6 (subunit J)
MFWWALLPHTYSINWRELLSQKSGWPSKLDKQVLHGVRIINSDPYAMTSVISYVSWGVATLCCILFTVGHVIATVRKRTERSKSIHALSVIIFLVYVTFVVVGLVSFIRSNNYGFSGKWANIDAQQIIFLFDVSFPLFD